MYAAAGSVVVAALIVLLGRRVLRRVDDGPKPAEVEAQAIALGQ
ncbi:hypothetical protein [Nocardiopsis tropica]|uniref:MFS transporter n=1 Tax=Nocardiopsis tropica TaxID=109330 RepID=A0ABU7KNJ9_9ACTN|nr:hypothetical protein [Nocardiopsis umidischolae]MEE2050878.1 hypothetical protein [Nocardiopsis umidischolae]